MKKLMIAALAAATVGGAYAACSYIPKQVTTTDPAWAYQWKFTGKTTKAVETTCNAAAYITRASASLKIQGWSIYCDPECGDFEAMEATEIFWQTKPGKVVFDLGSGVSFEVANVIGKKGKDYEVAGSAKFAATDDKGLTIADYALTFAGLGKYDAKNTRVSSIKGNFAGTALAPSLTSYNKTNCTYEGKVSKVWECCGCPTADAASVAYGKWSVKYNKSLAKKVANNNGNLNDDKILKAILPSWAR